jgi:DNA-binding CsgD family transcriptional regulator
VDTPEAAQQLFLSPNAVQDHLKSVFDKTGTRSRRVLLSRALGTAPVNPTDRQPSG